MLGPAEGYDALATRLYSGSVNTADYPKIFSWVRAEPVSTAKPEAMQQAPSN
jgi:hypothetical protein